MSHFDAGNVMDTLRENFITGAIHRKAVPFETAERIWEMMAAFAGYGFPKAHAASYAQLAWNSAWCRPITQQNLCVLCWALEEAIILNECT